MLIVHINDLVQVRSYERGLTEILDGGRSGCSPILELVLGDLYVHVKVECHDLGVEDWRLRCGV